MSRAKAFTQELPEHMQCIAEGCNLPGVGRHWNACSPGCDTARRQSLKPPTGCEPRHVARLKTLGDVDNERRLDCKRYDACLTYTAALNWNSFSCNQCPVRDEFTEEERRELLMRSFVVVPAMVMHEVKARA